MDINFKNKLNNPETTGGDSSPSKKKMKFKFNKKTIIIGGTILIAGFLLFRSLTKSNTTTQVLEPYPSEYGQNGVPGTSPNTGAIEESLGTAMTQFATDMQNQMSKNNEDVYSYLSKSLQEMSTATQSALQAQQQNGAGFENMMNQFATEIGGALDGQNKAIGGLEQLFNESLFATDQRFKAMEQSNTDMFNSFSQMLSLPATGSTGSTILTPRAPTNPVSRSALLTPTQKTAIALAPKVNVAVYKQPATKAQQTHNEVVKKAQAGVKLVNPTKQKVEVYNAVKNSDEIKRKALAGIKLVNPTKPAVNLYNATKNSAEIKRKAEAGIKLVNPTAEAMQLYNSFKK